MRQGSNILVVIWLSFQPQKPPALGPSAPSAASSTVERPGLGAEPIASIPTLLPWEGTHALPSPPHLQPHNITTSQPPNCNPTTLPANPRESVHLAISSDARFLTSNVDTLKKTVHQFQDHPMGADDAAAAAGAAPPSIPGPAGDSGAGSYGASGNGGEVSSVGRGLARILRRQPRLMTTRAAQVQRNLDALRAALDCSEQEVGWGAQGWVLAAPTWAGLAGSARSRVVEKGPAQLCAHTAPSRMPWGFSALILTPASCPARIRHHPGAEMQARAFEVVVPPLPKQQALAILRARSRASSPLPSGEPPCLTVVSQFQPGSHGGPKQPPHPDHGHHEPDP